MSHYYPVKCFLLSWFVVVFIRLAGLMNYDSVSIETSVSIVVFIVTFVCGYIFGVNKVISVKRIFLLSFRGFSPRGNLLFLMNLTILLSVICIFFMYLKVRGLSERYDADMSLSGFTEIRGASIGDDTKELGSSIYGMIATLLFGFPLLAGIIAIYYEKILSRVKRYLLNISFFGGILTSFMTGGRFTAFTFLIIYLFARKLSPVKLAFKTKLILSLAAIIFILISGQIFMDRLSHQDISQVAYYLRLCKPKSFTETLIRYNPNLTTVVIYFEYYIAHGVNQLDVLLNAPQPKSFPYLGAYEFKTFVLMLNKIGFNIINSDKIVSEIVNPGVYFTQIGAMYLDFGYFLSSLVTLLFGVFTGISWRNFLHFKGISDLLVCVILLSLISVSSIVSLIGAGYFSAILVVAVFLYFFNFFFPLPIYTEDV